MPKGFAWTVGVDEAGRGPLAGPISVGIVAVPAGFNVRRAFPGVKDSKQLSEPRREEIYRQLRELSRENPLIRYCVRFGGSRVIDGRGISPVTRAAVARGVRALVPDARDARVLLDGSLHAPLEYEQETIIGGDDSVALISLASIVAKVRRDRLMKRLALLYPEYGFEIHKGYGTKLHYEMLEKHGPCAIHRQSFLHLADTP